MIDITICKITGYKNQGSSGSLRLQNKQVTLQKSPALVGYASEFIYESHAGVRCLRTISEYGAVEAVR